MCGIVGYTGSREATPLIMEGLKRLEYRGYDSAGLAVVRDGKLTVEKTAGKLSALEHRLASGGNHAGTLALGHTRWATHGAPTETNAHPHLDVDGTIAGTEGECKEGMDMSYKGIWGYAPLLVTLANTGEILYTRNRPGNRPSHDGCFDYLDPAVDLVREAGFRNVRLRGDGHFSLTDDFDYWTKQSVEFVFGLPAHPKLVEIAEGLEERKWRELRRDRRAPGKRRGSRKPRIKRKIIEERGYRHLELEQEEYTEFAYRPTKCSREYRVVVLRKTINVKEGQTLLLPEIRYHFYITNAPKSELTARQVIRNANDRCNQENLIEQTKNGVHAMRMPCDTLLANDAYMLIACLAWNLKAWIAQLWPNREQGEELKRMEFRRFVASIIAIPCQVVSTGRNIVHRFLAYSSWLEAIFRAHDHLKRLVFV